MPDAAFSSIDLDAPSPVLLALPGCGCSPRIFDAIALDGIRLHALDWSRSPGPLDPASVAERLAGRLARRRGPVFLLGHSAGGAIAMLTAACAPAHVDALVISNTGVDSRAHGDPSLPERIRRDWTADARAAFLRSCFARPPAAPLWQALCDYLAGLPRDALLQAVEGLRRTDLSGHLDRIRVPTLIAHGRDDHRRRVEDAQALARGIPGARLALVPGGHTPMVDEPAAYRDTVAPFLAALPRRPPA